MKKSYLYLIASLLALNYAQLAAAEIPDPNEPSMIAQLLNSWKRMLGFDPAQAKPCDHCQNGTAHPGTTSGMTIPAPASGNSYSAGPATQGGGGGSIGSVTINQAGMDNATRIALEKEKTRQLELANAHALQIEHERNKWLNGLALYFDQRLKEQAAKGQTGNLDEVKKTALELLDHHHQALSDLVEQHDRVELKKLPLMLRHDREKTELLHEQAIEKLRMIGDGISNFVSDRERMTTAALGISAAALGIYAAKRGTKVVADVTAAHLLQPALVSETSRRSLSRLAKAPLKTVFGKKDNLPAVICNPELQAQIDTYVASIKQGRLDKQPFRHGLFYGAPGTGKTLLARQIARNLGMEFAEVPGPNLGQYHKQDALREVNKLFNWANSSPKGTVLFFDECDALAPKRTGDTSEQTRAVLNAVLAHTGSEMPKVLMIGATNEPGLLDPAFLNRFDERLEFTKPDQGTRAKLLHQYFDRYVTPTKRPTKLQSLQQSLKRCMWGASAANIKPTATDINVEPTVERALDAAAHSIEGFSGREISQLARAIRAKAATTADKTVTDMLVREITAQKIDQQAKLQAHTVRDMR